MNEARSTWGRDDPEVDSLQMERTQSCALPRSSLWPSWRCRIVLRIARRERGRRFELRGFLGVGDRKEGGAIE